MPTAPRRFPVGSSITRAILRSRRILNLAGVTAPNGSPALCRSALPGARSFREPYPTMPMHLQEVLLFLLLNGFLLLDGDRSRMWDEVDGGAYRKRGVEPLHPALARERRGDGHPRAIGKPLLGDDPLTRERERG